MAEVSTDFPKCTPIEAVGGRAGDFDSFRQETCYTSRRN
jgi:hypothetical protein